MPWRSYVELVKPRVIALMMFTVLVGMLLSRAGWPPWTVLAFGTLGIGLVAASAAAANHVIDQRIDALMARTRGRPLPRGVLSTAQAAVFAISLGLAGLVLLLWVAVTGQVDAGALVLFLIILIWTPPHFWALAIHRRDDYARAGIPMLPVVRGVPYTTAQILTYSIALGGVSLLPVAIGMSGTLYLFGALALGARFIVCAWRLRRDITLAMPTFRYSIVYLFALFALLLADHWLAHLGG
jgi:protoheme IX farnesyltransferase